MVNPQQELFTKLVLDLRKIFDAKGVSVYDGFLPPDGTAYPFVYIGEFRQADTATKKGVIGSVYPMIHVYHDDPCKRGTVSCMLLDIIYALRNIEHTDNFAWCIRDIQQNVMHDNTTKTPLLHGVVQATMRFS